MNNTLSQFAYIEAKNKYGAKAICNFTDDGICKTWLENFIKILYDLGFLEEEINQALEEIIA